MAIYFFEYPTLRVVKIGFASSISAVGRRLNVANVWAPCPIRVIGLVPDATQEDERAIHAELSESNTRGEFFRLDKNLRALIRAASVETPDEIVRNESHAYNSAKASAFYAVNKERWRGYEKKRRERKVKKRPR